MINYEQFSQTELQVAEVKTAERVTGSDKLLKLMISLGEEERQIIAGIGKAYEPESLIGKQIIAVVNFPPKKIALFFSECLVLGVYDEKNQVILLQPDKTTSNGFKIG